MPDERTGFLKRANIATLATVGPLGHPHAVPIWYLYEDGKFLMISPKGAQKVKNLRRTGRATLVIDRRDIPYFAVTAHGFVEVGKAPSQDLYFRWASHYLGDDLGRRYVSARRREDEVCLLLQPDRITEFRSGLDQL